MDDEPVRDDGLTKDVTALRAPSQGGVTARNCPHDLFDVWPREKIVRAFLAAARLVRGRRSAIFDQGKRATTQADTASRASPGRSRQRFPSRGRGECSTSMSARSRFSANIVIRMTWPKISEKIVLERKGLSALV
jgi:hypothetical protein